MFSEAKGRGVAELVGNIMKLMLRDLHLDEFLSYRLVKSKKLDYQVT